MSKSDVNLARSLTGGRAAGVQEKGISVLLFLCAALSIVVTAGILVILLTETIDFFRDVSIADFLGDSQWTPSFADAHFGVWPLITGTLMTAAIAIAVALPFGLLAAIYLSEYASPRQRKLIKPTLEVLAGVPTVVFGYFALTFVTPILQKVVPGLSGFNALSPGIIMGVMIIPMVSSLSEDAIHAVPNALREGALGLGATKLSTTFRVTVPAALSGIAAAVTLAISRAIGETMIVTIAAGQRPTLTMDPRVPIETMTAYIVSMAKGDLPTDTPVYRTIFAVGTTLFVLTFAMNMLSQRFTRKVRQSYSS